MSLWDYVEIFDAMDADVDDFALRVPGRTDEPTSPSNFPTPIDCTRWFIEIPLLAYYFYYHYYDYLYI